MTLTTDAITPNSMPIIRDFSGEGRIYSTTFKKNGIVNHMHFQHAGDLNAAVEAVKIYLNKHHLKHIHTVPFLVDLEEKNINELDSTY